MKIDGGCYCGAVRYHVEGDALFAGQCHCRECQYITGGNPNLVMGLPDAGFAYTNGSPSTFRRKDLENAVAREFCGECGTHLLSRTSAVPGAVLIKIGTFDEPAMFPGPQLAIYLVDKQPFHHVPDGVPTFDRTPG